MRQYQLSEQRLKRVLRTPNRKEEGVAPGTVALMQTSGTKKHPKEIWLMYQQKGKKALKVISAWRYPGTSPLGKPVPVPQDILEELFKEGTIK